MMLPLSDCGLCSGAVSVGFNQGNFPNSLIKKNHEDITGVPECLRNKENENCLELLEKVVISSAFCGTLKFPAVSLRAVGDVHFFRGGRICRSCLEDAIAQ